MTRRPVPLAPGPGQESVWAYPRPPRLERTPKQVQIWLGGEQIADTDWSASDAFRVLETSHPPGYYLPPDAFAPGVLSRASGSSVCEFKGAATYWTLTGGGQEACGRRAGATNLPRPLSAKWPATWRSTPEKWTSAGWRAKWSGRSRVSFTAAGSPQRWQGRLRVKPGRWAGSTSPLT